MYCVSESVDVCRTSANSASAFSRWPSLREDVRAQARGALVVVLRLARDHPLEIGRGGRKIVQRDFAQRAPVERIDRFRFREHLVEALARPRELPVVEIEIAELFVVADRRIVEDEPFELLDALSAREDLKRAAQQAGVGNDFDDDVDQRADAAEHEDDPEPVRLGPATHEVQNRQGLQDDAVRVDEPEHSARTITDAATDRQPLPPTTTHRVIWCQGVRHGQAPSVEVLLSLVILFFVVGVLAVVGAWMVVSRGPSVPDHSTLILRIGGELVETPPNDVLGQLTGGARAQTVRGYVEALRRAKSDPRIDSVLIIPTPFQSPYWGKVQEIRDAVLDFRKSGKRISAYLEYAGEREYYLATAAEKIYLVPTSSLDVTGIATYEVFLKGTLDKIGAQADFEKIGDYKTAPNQLTQTTFTPPHREMTESLTRDMYEQLVRGIAETPQEKSGGRAGADRRGPVPRARCACVRAWSTGWRMKISSTITAPSARAAPWKGSRTGARAAASAPRGAPRIAVVYVSGIINSGDSGFDPLNGEVAGSVGLVKAIRSARADDSVRAIVVRIDSPGGSSIASDVIWRELTVTKNEKPSRPLVASMSDLAASGGYYVAMAAPQHRGAARHADRARSAFSAASSSPAARTRSWARTSSRSSSGATRASNRPSGRSPTASARSCASRFAISTTASSRKSRRRERCRSSVSISWRRGACGPARRRARTAWSTRSAASIARSRSRRSAPASRPRPKLKS